MATKKITLPLKKALAELELGDKKKTDKAFQTIAKSGNVLVLKELLNMLLNKENAYVNKKIFQLIADISDKAVKEILIDALNDERFESVRTSLINTVWNSKIDFSEFIAEFVALSLQGDFMQAIECLTVIENLAGPFEEHHLLESQLYLKEYYSDLKKERGQKDEIIGDIAVFIREQNDGIDADLLLE